MVAARIGRKKERTKWSNDDERKLTYSIKVERKRNWTKK